MRSIAANLSLRHYTVTVKIIRFEAGGIMRIKLVPSVMFVMSVIFVTMLAVMAISQSKSSQLSNQLTKAEKDAGWRLLFDGKSFNGWRGFHSDKVPEGWVIEDGAIKKLPGLGELGQAGGDLITADE